MKKFRPLSPVIYRHGTDSPWHVGFYDQPSYRENFHIVVGSADFVHDDEIFIYDELSENKVGKITREDEQDEILKILPKELFS